MSNDNITKFFRRVNKENLSDKVASQIQKLIFSEKIKIEDKLPSERELATLFGVSRVVVREALISLEKFGLIETRKGAQHNGTYVVFNLYKPFFDSMNMLFRDGGLSLRDFVDVRSSIECLSVKLAAIKSNETDIQNLKQINNKLLDDTIDRDMATEINDSFHVAIADITGNKLIKVIVKSSLELLNSLVLADMEINKITESLFQRHAAIIEAMIVRDVERCERFMAEDVEYTAKLSPHNLN